MNVLWETAEREACLTGERTEDLYALFTSYGVGELEDYDVED